MRLEQIQPQYVVQIWPDVEPLLEPAMAHSAGECSLDQLKAMLVAGRQALLVFWDDQGIHGALSVAPELYPNASIACVTACGGRAIANKENFDQLAAWCREHGHTRLRGFTFTPATRLWQRLGMQEIYRVMETTL